ncbi:ribonuclease HIII [Thermocrinis sp.]
MKPSLNQSTIKLPKDHWDIVVEHLLTKGFWKRDVLHTYASLSDGKNFVNIYTSGSLLIQGEDVESLKAQILGLVQVEDVLVGCDESGKGDVFGPLVLCCCVLKPENYKEVLSIVPKDSKRIKDKQLFSKVQALENLVEFRCIVLQPRELNQIYQQKGNLNRILDETYRELLKEVQRDYPEAKITVDAYSHRNPFGGLVNFEHKAEERVEVACASMRARYEFLNWLRLHNLPKGSSSEVMEKARGMLNSEDYVKLFFLK